MKTLAVVVLAACLTFGCVPKESAAGTATGSPPVSVISQRIPEANRVPQAPQVTETPTPPKSQTRQRNPRRLHQLDDLATTKIGVGDREIVAWVMDEDSKRAEGMMFLTDAEVKEEEAMIFVFGNSEPRGFWMQNTILPLDLAFVDERGLVLNVAQGRPFDESPIRSRGSAMYVIEMKKGMCAKVGIRAGVRVRIDPKLKSLDGN